MNPQAAYDAQMAAMRAEYNTRMSNLRSSKNRKIGELEAKNKKLAKDNRAAQREMRTAWMRLLWLLVISGVLGIGLGSQVQRVMGPRYGTWTNLGLLVLGVIALAFAKRNWHYIFAFSLIMMGGVAIGNYAEARDWVPGEWDNRLQERFAEWTAEAEAEKKGK